MSNVETKRCPICTKDLPISAFGICRARRDGRNLYCMSCIRSKVTANRRALKEYKANRKQYQARAVEYLEDPLQSALVSKLSPVERVKESIRKGNHTQRDIAADTKIGKDEIGDAIANLLLWTKEIRTQPAGDVRVYFINEVPERPEVEYPAAESWREVARKANRIEIKGERRIQKVA